MNPFLEAASEINALWASCAGTAIEQVECPSNEQIAEIIRKYFDPPKEAGNTN